MNNSFFKLFITFLFLKVFKLKYILTLFSLPPSPFILFPFSYQPTSSSFSKNRQKYNTAATPHQKNQENNIKEHQKKIPNCNQIETHTQKKKPVKFIIWGLSLLTYLVLVWRKLVFLLPALVSESSVIHLYPSGYFQLDFCWFGI